jgi:hypothetical protein
MLDISDEDDRHPLFYPPFTKKHYPSIVYEYPKAEGDPYYPVPRSENAELYKKYKALAEATSGVHFVGRLATYKYYNMDQVVAQALALYAQLAERSNWHPETESPTIQKAIAPDKEGDRVIKKSVSKSSKAPVPASTGTSTI